MRSPTRVWRAVLVPWVLAALCAGVAWLLVASGNSSVLSGGMGFWWTIATVVAAAILAVVGLVRLVMALRGR